MYHEEEEDQGSEDGHGTGVPGAGLGNTTHSVFVGTRGAVHSFQGIALYDVEDETGKQPDLHDTDQCVCTHEIGRPVKVLFSVFKQNVRINIGMYEEEKDQE